MSLLDEINVLVEQYMAFLRDRINLREVGKHVAISTPFMDRHNDGFVIYATKTQDGKFILTDDGAVMNDLEQSGCEFTTPLRKQVLETILLSNGVQLKGGELKIETSANDFAARKSNLLTAMMELNDMYVLAAGRTKSFFFEDVSSWLSNKKIGYATDVKLQGSSGYQFPVDFLIGRGNEPEMALQTLAAPDVPALAKMILMKNELSYRSTDVRVMMNDEAISPKTGKDLVALSESQNLPIYFWSSRERVDFLA